jgi:hypothetical protein
MVAAPVPQSRGHQEAIMKLALMFAALVLPTTGAYAAMDCCKDCKCCKEMKGEQPPAPAPAPQQPR